MTILREIERISELLELLLEFRRSGKTIGLVPTMGALHAGHRRLFERARAENDAVVASIFVNPAQFNSAADLERYPRTLDADLAMCREAGVDLVFAPAAGEMYPEAQRTWVEVPSLGEHLCGPGRPGHFRGVATVVLKLLNVVQPDRAYFGEKDAQQLAIIRRMVKDLNVSTVIVPVETVREPDGLAMSSRNRNLNAVERGQAVVLSQALFAARDLIGGGERSVKAVEAAVLPLFKDVRLEYFSVVDLETLVPVERVSGPVLIAGAMWVGATRLIDNVKA